MAKKVGVVLILAGFCLPLVLFFFAEGYNGRLGLLWSIPQMDMVLRERQSKLMLPSNVTKEYKEFLREQEKKPPGKTDYAGYSIWEDRLEKFRLIIPPIIIPYKYPVAIGIILIFTGIGIVALSKSKSGSPTKSN